MGYFLTVIDTRAAWGNIGGDDFGELCESVSESGSGVYLFARTASVGIGKQITKDAIRKLWRLYEVPAEGMVLLDRDLKTHTVASPDLQKALDSILGPEYVNSIEERR